MGTNAKLLAKGHAIAVDFGAEVINRAISCASRGVDISFSPPGTWLSMRKKDLPDMSGHFFDYVNVKNETLRDRDIA